MFDCYDLSKIPLILAIGCKNYEETGKVKGCWAKTDLLRPFGESIWHRKMTDTRWLHQNFLSKQQSRV